jgi:hypothetical protein
MRLLNVKTVLLEEFLDGKIPHYAILSHTWGEDEVSFQDIQQSDVHKKQGYTKIQKACDQALKDGLEYVWVDTCCIDKGSSAELSEAINSMFRWYEGAEVCYAYLVDVPPNTEPRIHDSAFSQSRWFTRGWTLQELLAPSKLIFFACDWSVIASSLDLLHSISSITGIDVYFLLYSYSQDVTSRLSQASIAERMSWASKRQTTRKEDMAYCLLGIFDTNLPLIYGEGEKAFFRLQEEIMKHSDDQSLFAWNFPLEHRTLSPPFLFSSIILAWKEPYDSGNRYYRRQCGILAPSPVEFAGSGSIISSEGSGPVSHFSMTNRGIHVDLPIFRSRSQGVYVLLGCQLKEDPSKILAMPLAPPKEGNCYARATFEPVLVDHAFGNRWHMESLYLYVGFQTLNFRWEFLNKNFFIQSLPEGFHIEEVYPPGSRSSSNRAISTALRELTHVREVLVLVTEKSRGLRFVLILRTRGEEDYLDTPEIGTDYHLAVLPPFPARFT